MSGATPEIVVCRDPAAVAAEAAARFLRAAEQAAVHYRAFTMALAGGSTPKGLYTLLAGEPWREQVPWELIHCFWGDERCVPPDHADSNYKLAADALLTRVPLPATNLHRVPTETHTCVQAAADYAQELITFFGLERGALPRFDLILLGLGDDGHTASLFPGAAALEELQALAVVSPPGRLPPPVDRVTLTLPVLNAAAHVMFLVTGAGKAEVVGRILHDPVPAEDDLLPAQRVRPTDGTITWILDEAAASQLAQEGDS